MRCLVTGASGFVGRALTRALTDAGHQVRAVVRQPGLRSDDRAVTSAALDQVVGDLTEATDEVLAEWLAEIDTVFHLAARTHQHNAPPAAYEQLNVGVTERLAHASVVAGVGHFVFVSSVKAVGEETHDTPFSADTPEHPQDAYGRTKLSAERQLRAISDQSALPISIVRPPLVYGSGALGNLASLILTIQRGVPLPLRTVENQRSMISRDNLVDLLVALTDRPLNRVALPADVHLSTPQLIEAIAKSLNQPSRLFGVPPSLLELAGQLTGQSERSRRLTRSLVVTDPWLTQQFAWRPPHDPEGAIRKMVIDVGASHRL